MAIPQFVIILNRNYSWSIFEGSIAKCGLEAVINKQVIDCFEIKLYFLIDSDKSFRVVIFKPAIGRIMIIKYHDSDLRKTFLPYHNMTFNLLRNTRLHETSRLEYAI